MAEPATFAGGFRKHGRYGGETLDARSRAVMREYQKTPGVLHPAVVVDEGTTPHAALAAEHQYLRNVTDQLVRETTAPPRNAVASTCPHLPAAALSLRSHR